jgi:cyclic pyranopterin phosphate synthase
MPAEGVPLLQHSDILSFDEIFQLTQTAVSMGVDKVRITGGEPLVRRGIVDLIKMLAAIPGIRDLAMTTNGILLNKYAQPLADAGLDRVNISLDTLDAEKYKSITRLGKLSNALTGIEAADKAGLHPIKINCVIKAHSSEADAQAVKAFAMEHGYQVRFIPEMDLETGSFGIVEGGDGGNCKKCNRLRLTSDGKIKPCLFSDLAYDVRELGPQKAIEKALKNKPRSGTVNHINHFNNIGG